MRRSWYILIVYVAVSLFGVFVAPAVATQANILLQTSPTSTTAASVTSTTASGSATATTPTASTPTTTSGTSTPIVVTSTPFIVTATPSTGTSTPIVVTATFTPSPIPPTATNVTTLAAPAISTGQTRRAEIRFLTEAIDTNQIAVALANDCLTKAQDSQVMTLCQQMSTAHASDIQQLHTYLLSTYQLDYPATSTVTATMATTSAATSAVPGIVVALTSPQGVAYEVAWLEAMIDIHSDLVSLENRVLSFPINPALRTMVSEMRATAITETSTMQGNIARLGGSR